ncbi:hypothetical protein XHC_0864, partial [Xanthomonas hortorum pv. carotae str. M081]
IGEGTAPGSFLAAFLEAICCSAFVGKLIGLPVARTAQLTHCLHFAHRPSRLVLARPPSTRHGCRVRAYRRTCRRSRKW